MDEDTVFFTSTQGTTNALFQTFENINIIKVLEGTREEILRTYIEHLRKNPSTK